MFYGNEDDEDQVMVSTRLIVIIFLLLIKLIAYSDAGSFILPVCYIHLTVKPYHVFAYFHRVPDQ